MVSLSNHEAGSPSSFDKLRMRAIKGDSSKSQRALRAEAGAAALEFAILAPVFLLMATGLLAYGIYFGAAHSVQQLAADAARTSIAGLTATERASLVANFVAANAEGYPLLDGQALSYAVGPEPDDPDDYRVTLSYDASSKSGNGLAVRKRDKTKTWSPCSDQSEHERLQAHGPAGR